jgi:predicted protein tyrosine phosphatase
MKIKVLNRDGFEKFIDSEPYIVISITDPNSEKVKPNKIYLDMLSLQFHDVDKSLVKREECTACKGTGILKCFADINDGHCYRCTDKMDIKLFTDENAKQILDFVEKYKLEIETIIVHCEAGISRSAGVAGALSLIYNGTDQLYFDDYLPNMLVYRKILNAYMRNKNEK